MQTTPFHSYQTQLYLLEVNFIFAFLCNSQQDLASIELQVKPVVCLVSSTRTWWCFISTPRRYWLISSRVLWYLECSIQPIQEALGVLYFIHKDIVVLLYFHYNRNYIWWKSDILCYGYCWFSRNIELGTCICRWNSWNIYGWISE